MKVTRFLALMLALLMVLCACGEKPSEKEEKEDPAETVAKLEQEIEEKQEILSKLGELYYELQGADEEEYEDLIREIFGDDADQVKVKTDEDGNLVIKYGSDTPEEIEEDLEKLFEKLEKAKKKLEKEEGKKEDEDEEEGGKTENDGPVVETPEQDEPVVEGPEQDEPVVETPEQGENEMDTPVVNVPEEPEVDGEGNPIIVGKVGRTSYKNTYFGIYFSGSAGLMVSTEEDAADYMDRLEFNEYVYDRQTFTDMVAYDGNNNTINGVVENISHAKDQVPTERAYLEIAVPQLKSSLAGVGVSADPQLTTVTVGGVEKDAIVTNYSLNAGGMYYITQFCILKGDHIMVFTVAGTSEAKIEGMLAGFEFI